ncbi:MAG: hypothetical protein HY678_11225, partial [Chloroflexi bacterium]|nr:hypothetical protein [Chloroflexota bacterium]
MNFDLHFSKPLLVYVPAFNCATVIDSVIKGIPAAVWDVADCLVVDNCSTDGTVQ